MDLETKDIVTKFYESNFYKDEEVLKAYLHEDVELRWYGSTGFRKLNLEGISEITREISETYESLRAETEKIISNGSEAAIHFTYFVRTIENPEEEMPLAHFVAMWELKDGKLFKGVQISQLGEEIDEDPWS